MAAGMQLQHPGHDMHVTLRQAPLYNDRQSIQVLNELCAQTCLQLGLVLPHSMRQESTTMTYAHSAMCTRYAYTKQKTIENDYQQKAV